MLQPRRICAWCKGPIAPNKRPESIFCRQRCRQASHRFAVRRTQLRATAQPRTFAYADPPYIGKARYYPEKREVDHAALIRRLRTEYPDGWALSTSSEALLEVWSICPEAKLRIWVKVPMKVKSYSPAVSFEALLIAGGRMLGAGVAQDLEDSLVYRGRHRAFPGAMMGMKPPAFAEWMFRLLGARRGDTLDDLFPGSGAIGEAWRRYTGESTAAMKRVAR